MKSIPGAQVAWVICINPVALCARNNPREVGIDRVSGEKCRNNKIRGVIRGTSLVIPVGTQRCSPKKILHGWVAWEEPARRPVPSTAFKRSSVITNCAALFFSFDFISCVIIRFDQAYGIRCMEMNLLDFTWFEINIPWLIGRLYAVSDEKFGTGHG